MQVYPRNLDLTKSLGGVKIVHIDILRYLGNELLPLPSHSLSLSVSMNGLTYLSATTSLSPDVGMRPCGKGVLKILR